MTISTGFETQLTIAEETTYKAVPSAVNYDEINQKSSSLSVAFENINVERIRGDRNAETILKGTESVSGDITVDLCPDADHNVMIAAVFCDAVDIDEGTPSTFTIGTTQRTYTLIQQLKSDEFHQFSGCQFNGFSLSVGASGTIETTFTVMGATLTAAASHAGSGITAVTTAEVVPWTAEDAVVNFNSVDSAVCTEISLSVDNGMPSLFVVGDNTPIQGHLGKAAVTGSMTVLFDTTTEYDRFLAYGLTAINITIGTGGTGIQFQMPSCKLTSGTVEIASDGAVTASLEFTALYDASIASSILFDNAL